MSETEKASIYIKYIQSEGRRARAHVARTDNIDTVASRRLSATADESSPLVSLIRQRPDQIDEGNDWFGRGMIHETVIDDCGASNADAASTVIGKFAPEPEALRVADI